MLRSLDDELCNLLFVIVLIVVTVELLIDLQMSGRVQSVSEKYSILRSTSESGIFSRLASSTIREIKNSFASRALWNRAVSIWRIVHPPDSPTRVSPGTPTGGELPRQLPQGAAGGEGHSPYVFFAIALVILP
jgi:hypothetical protein